MEFTKAIAEAINNLLQEVRDGIDLSDKVVVSPTRKEFEGDYTVVVFPFVPMMKKSPEQAAAIIGEHLKSSLDIVEDFNVIKGFLNLSLSKKYWTDRLLSSSALDLINNKIESKGATVMVEFSSPNTNKPLHLGHIRNILLGWSTSKLLKAAGYKVVNTQIVNDRGIAICKSMLAWQKFGNGETPESSGVKGDHLIGKYYVLFEKHFKEEFAQWQESEEAQNLYKKDAKEGEEPSTFFKRYKNIYFNTHGNLGSEAKEMLNKWEANDPEVKALWSKLNSWVYRGFDETYKALGVDFDSMYYESDTYLLGKEVIEKGLANEQFYKKEDGSVWIDLEDVGLDQKLVLRSDGTSVYMTQDIGTADLRYTDHKAHRMIYVVGNEQDYHFKALFEIMKKLDRPFAKGLHHLSYGMVDLPEGKMKSREGTVVDADDLVQEVIDEAKANAEDREIKMDLSVAEQEEVNRKVGVAALKYFILKVNPKKRIVFDPKESVDMQGHTGPYIQNAYVRVKSIIRKFLNDENGVWLDLDKGFLDLLNGYNEINEIEIELISLLDSYKQLILDAAEIYDASVVANFAYKLAKQYHKFYHDVRILSAKTEEAKSFRLALCQLVAQTLKHSMDILGIEMPEKM